MKKFIISLLSFALVVSFAGCSKPDNDTLTEPTEKQRETMGAIQQTVLYDNNGITVTANTLEQTINGARIHVTICNDTDLPVAFSTDDIIVNGLTLTDGFCIEAAAGRTEADNIDISYRSMDNANITNIAYIECTDARIYETKEFAVLDTASFRIETSIIADYAQLYPETGTVVYDKNGIKVQILGCVAGERVTDARLLVTNNTEGAIAIKCKNPTSSGKALNTWMFDTVYAGTSRYCYFEFTGIDHTNVTAELDLYSIGESYVLIAELGSQSFTIED